MTSPLSPEAVAQMVADLDLFSRCGDVGVMDRDMAIDAKATITTLAAENATLRSENDIWTERSTDAELNWANCTRLAQRLRASEAAALERVKVLTDALKETYDNLFYQLEAKRGPQFASEYPSIRRAEKALTPTADKEPTT